MFMWCCKLALWTAAGSAIQAFCGESTNKPKEQIVDIDAADAGNELLPWNILKTSTNSIPWNDAICLLHQIETLNLKYGCRVSLILQLTHDNTLKV
ncbi:hypothetical protein L6164_025267 [Bauhinia variegata]|uniref:Uncharacterized protein n=1 Tax=Bauhinia variegata TaxID=167791 RepID=A0ACB9M015_BAUVA|nr:hypothetical protein L6164_025267 [Bauhinia variegata]